MPKRSCAYAGRMMNSLRTQAVRLKRDRLRVAPAQRVMVMRANWAFCPGFLGRGSVLLLLAGMCSPLLCLAEVYGWIDSNGVVTYSNLPPPNGVDVTEVIHEVPMSPKAVAEANHRAEIDALQDRIRLLELEQARAQRVLVDYPGPPPAPAGMNCAPGGYVDCSPDWGTYYTTGVLLNYPYHYGRGYYAAGIRRGPVARPGSVRVSRAGSVQGSARR